MMNNSESEALKSIRVAVWGVFWMEFARQIFFLKSVLGF
jgi:hypothetical protein